MFGRTKPSSFYPLKEGSSKTFIGKNQWILID